MRRKTRTRLLEAGDVLKTNPREGFWGAAIVLSAQAQPSGQAALLCLIGVTPVVFQHDFAFDELRNQPLTILRFERWARAGVGRHVPGRLETCIGIYSRLPAPPVPVFGRLEVSTLAMPRLTFKAGDGADGGWPLCGRVTRHLGSEAITAWLMANDPDRHRAERDEARASHEVMVGRAAEARRGKRRPPDDG